MQKQGCLGYLLTQLALEYGHCVYLGYIIKAEISVRGNSFSCQVISY